MINLIAAVGKNNEIGYNNKLLWHIPDDLKFFKKMTTGKIVVMGRKTFESLPCVLSNRKMVVISSHEILKKDVLHFSTFDNCLKYLQKNNNSDIFIIGGSSIYKQFLDYADNIYLTEINSSFNDADTFFPTFKKSDWKREIIKLGKYNDIDYTICKYLKKK